jgi:tetratricopeptide (TPR) repeat protein
MPEPDGHYHLARAFRLLGRTEEAKREIERALAADPGFLPAEILKLELITEDSAEQRREKIEKLAALYEDQEGWERWWLEAYTCVENQQWPEAASAYGKLIASGQKGTEPYVGSLIEAHLGLGLAHLETGEYFAAQRRFANAEALAPGVEPVLLLAKACYLNDQKEEAEKTFERLHEAAGDKREAALWIVMVYRSLGDLEKAYEWAERLGEDPIRPRIRAYLLYQLNRMDEAILAGREAIGCNAEDPIAHLVLASALSADLFSRPVSERQGKLAELLSVSRRAMDLDPQDADARRVLALAEAERNQRVLRVLRSQAVRNPRTWGMLWAAVVALSGFGGSGQAGEKGFWADVEMMPKVGQWDLIGSVSSDKKELYFTRYLNGQADMYVYRRNSPDDAWEYPPEPLTSLNSPGQDWMPSISRDGRELYFTSKRGGAKADLYVAERAWDEEAEAWGPWHLSALETTNGVQINTPDQHESVGRLCADGQQLFFSRGWAEAPRSGWDIHVAWRPGPGQPFERLKALDGINTTPDNEITPSPSADGKTLFFSDFKAGSTGAHGSEPDIWMAKRPDNEFDTPFGPRQNVDPPVSTFS